MGIFSGLFRKKLKCDWCGHVQTRGEWEKVMDTQARARGSSFFNLGASPQCLKCGSLDIRDPHEQHSTPEADPRIRQWCQELREIHHRYYVSQHTTADAERANRNMEAIGRIILHAGGRHLLAQVHNAMENPSVLRSVTHAWSNIGDDYPTPMESLSTRLAPVPEEKNRPCPLCHAQLPKELFKEGECTCPSCKGTFNVEYQ